MRVVRSNVLGFCMGVRRAVEMAAKAANSRGTSLERVFTLGPIVHNPKVLEDLKAQGVEALDSIPQDWSSLVLEKCTLVIRAHGIDPSIEEDFKNKGVQIVDATCPNVKRSQLIARSIINGGYKLFLAGDPTHAEIESLCGYGRNCSEDSLFVVSTAAEAAKAAEKLCTLNRTAITAIIAQTTISAEEYREIAAAIKKYFPSLEVVQTICGATKTRQQALRELLNCVEAVIIVGGKDSANTSRLLSIAQESGLPCVQIESAKEIPHRFYKYSTVGLSAGASTPDCLIDEVEMELLSVCL